MSKRKLLLCTDVDRTIIPNGVQSEHPLSRKRFSEFCAQPEVTLVYATGRHQKLVEQAIRLYVLPTPKYAITDIGTRIFQITKGKWKALHQWEEEIGKDWNGRSHGDLVQLFHDFSLLKLQERSKQNTHKLSYTIPLHADHYSIITQMEQRLQAEDIAASIIWGIDEPKGVGCLDILPHNATKLHAVRFLQEALGFKTNELIYAGDSSDDLSLLDSEIPTVLVANSTIDAQKTAGLLMNKKQHHNVLYLAKSNYINMNGNYASGVLEGIWHFAPDFRDVLKTICHLP